MLEFAVFAIKLKPFIQLRVGSCVAATESMKRGFICSQSGFRHGCQARRNSPTFKRSSWKAWEPPPLFDLLMMTALSSFQGHDWEPDYMVSFSPGSNFASPTGLKYCCNYMLNFSLGAKRKFPWESWGAKTQSMRMLAFLFRLGMKRMLAITWIFQPLWPGWNS